MVRILSILYQHSKCLGPPEFITYSPTSTTSTTSNFSNPFYEFVQNEYEPAQMACGDLPLPNSLDSSLQCCYESLIPLPLNIVSMQIGFDEDIALMSILSSFQYCSPPDLDHYYLQNTCLQYMNSTTTTLDPSTSTASSSSITNKTYLKCTSSNVTFYSDPSCKNQKTIPQNITSSFKFPHHPNPTPTDHLQIKWLAFTPSWKLVPVYDGSVVDYIGVISFSLALLEQLYVFMFFFRKWWARKSQYLLAYLFSSSLYLLWVALSLFYYVWVFQDQGEFALFAEVIGILLNVGTLTTVINSAQFLFTFTEAQGVWIRICVYTPLILLYLMLSGSLFFCYWKFIGPYQHFIKMWGTVSVYWIVLVFCISMIPFVVVTISLVAESKGKKRGRCGSLWSRLLKLHSNFPLLSALFTCQVISTVAFGVLEFMKQDTLIMGDDRMYLAADGLLSLFLSTHSVFSTLFVDNVALIAKVSVDTTAAASKSPITSHLRSEDLKALPRFHASQV